MPRAGTARGRQSTSAGRVTVVRRVPFGVSGETIARWVRSARRLLPAHSGLVVVTALGPTAIRGLNRHWRHHDRPTNVLSFRLDTPSTASPPRIWGELFLCPAVIRQEAPHWQRTYRQHLRALVEHGLLHLCGLDHETPSQRRQWNRQAHRLTTT